MEKSWPVWLLTTFSLLMLLLCGCHGTWDTCSMCSPEIQDLIESLRKKVDALEEKYFACCPGKENVHIR